MSMHRTDKSRYGTAFGIAMDRYALIFLGYTGSHHSAQEYSLIRIAFTTA